MSCSEIFRFKRFEICQDRVLMKITTDAVILGVLTDTSDALAALDVGTGSGVVAMMLAQKNRKLRVDGLEPHLPSAETARLNFKNAPFAGRLRIFVRSLQDFIPEAPYDLIVSNPPYYPASAKTDYNPARMNTTLRLADLFGFARNFLHENGRLNLIFPSANDADVLAAAYTNDLFPARKIIVSAHPGVQAKRSFWTFTREVDRDFEKGELILFDRSGKRTEVFNRLVSAYLQDDEN